MNNEIIKIIKDRNIHPISYQKIKNIYVINSKDKNYVIKLNTNNYDVYKYLISRDFFFFPENLNNSNDNYEIYYYIDNLDINKEQRLTDYIKLISLLHKKTSYNHEIDLDEIKEKYEELNKKINYLRSYYLELNDKLDNELFLSPSSYLLLRNISLIYSILDNDNILLNDIYQEIKNQKSIRVSMLHNNVDLDHLIINDKEYLISWNYSYFDSPIYEIEKIYRKYYHDISLNDLLNIYLNINKLNDLEKKLLIINLSLPKEIKLSNNTYLDTKIINEEINYLINIYDYIKKHQNTKTNLKD